jgi:hypothetical protein
MHRRHRLSLAASLTLLASLPPPKLRREDPPPPNPNPTPPAPTDPPPPAPPTPPADPPKPQFTQADIEAAVAKALETDKAARESADAAAKSKADQEKLIADGKLAEALALKDAENERLKADLAKKDLGDTRQQVALAFGFVGENAGLAAAIQGSTKEEMEASAKGLESFKKTPKAPNLDPGGGGNPPQPHAKDPVKNYVNNTYKPPTFAA